MNSCRYKFVFHHKPSRLKYIWKYYSKTDSVLSLTYFDSFFVTIIEHTATRLRSGRSVVRMSARVRDFHLLWNIKADSGFRLASHPMSTVVLFRGKWLKSDTDHSIPSSVQVREWNFTSTPLICLHGAHKYNLVFCWTTDYASVFPKNFSRFHRQRPEPD